MIKADRSDIDSILAEYGAITSVELSCLQSKCEGYIGDKFNYIDKPVYDFQIVSITDGLSFANINSDIYRKIPRHVLRVINEYYFETPRGIYVS